jgi:hypothetical protein
MKEDKIDNTCSRYGETTNTSKILLGNPNGTDQFGDLSLDESTVLKRAAILYSVNMWTEYNCLDNGAYIEIFVP